MGGVANTAARVGSGVLTLGGSELARKYVPGSPISQVMQAPGVIMTGGLGNGYSAPRPSQVAGSKINVNFDPEAYQGNADISTLGQNQYNQMQNQIAQNYSSALASMGGVSALGQQQYNANQSLLDQNMASYGQGQQSLLGQGQQNQSADQALGAQEQQQTNAFNTQDQAARAQSRQQLQDLLTKQAQESFARTLPTTAEDYNAGGLLNSTGYQQEVARQQGYLGQNIADQMSLAGINDINRSSALQQQGLGQLQSGQEQGLGSLQNYQGQSSQLGLQGQQYGRTQSQANTAQVQQAQDNAENMYTQANANAQQQGTANTGALQSAQQQALQRQYSLQDYARQANVASAIGANAAPQQQNASGGKGQTGALLSGLGSMAPMAGMLMGGPAGAAAGSVAGNAMANNGQVAMSPFGPVTANMVSSGGGK